MTAKPFNDRLNLSKTVEMISILRSKDWILYIFIATIIFCIAVPARAEQTAAQYIEKLEVCSNPENFEAVFGEMITAFKSGKMIPFEDEEVMEIVTIAREKSFSEMVLPAVYGWAGTMFGNGRMDKALTFFMESAELYGKQNKKLAQAYGYFEVALIQHKGENYDEAESYYAKTLSLGGDSLRHRTKINCYNGFALIERQKKNYKYAIREFRKAYAVAQINHDTVWMGILAGNIGSIHMSRAHYDSSLYYYLQNLKFIKNTMEFENEIETYSHLGKVYLLKSDYAKSKIYLDSAVQIIHDRQIRFNDFFNPMDYINESYALLYAATGDYKRAFEYYSQFHQIAQQKQLNVNGRSLKQLQSTYAFKQKNNEVELLTKINQANVLVIKQQRYIAAVFAVLILLMAIWAFNSYKTGQVRKNLNHELVASNHELERLNRVKDKLFSVLSHDLRSPIATLKSLVIFLQEGNLRQADLKPLYDGLRHQLEVSGNVLESLLQWAKSELSETKTSVERVVLANVVNSVAMQLKNAMDEKNIHLVNSLNFDLIAMADKTQLEIIIRNLMGNAIKFTPNGGIIKIAGKINALNIEVHVEDNGMGMQDDEVKNLFDPGKLFTTMGTNQEKGTGIGLFITKEMIAKNGGSIWVNSRKHEGTIFTFTLPIAVSG